MPNEPTLEELLVEASPKDMMPSDDSLGKMALMAKELALLEAGLVKAEQHIKDLESAISDLTCKRIPDFLAEIGMKEFKLLDGSKVEMGPKYYANISEARRAAAHAWLRANEFGGIIKNRFNVDFSKGQDEDAESFRLLLDANGVDFENKETVHAGTLTAFVKEQIEAGTELPKDLLGIHVQMEAKITKPKGKK